MSCSCIEKINRELSTSCLDIELINSYLNISYNSCACGAFEEEIKINYCPICGKKIIDKGDDKMRQFNLFAQDGDQISIKIDDVYIDNWVIKVKVAELKKKSDILYKDVTASGAFMSEENKIVLVFNTEDQYKLLDITDNQEMIDYIWDMSGADFLTHDLYRHTTEYKANFED